MNAAKVEKQTKLDLDRVNKWLTLLANLGVIAGIVFLIVEINQNTRTVRAAAIQNSTSVAREQIVLFVQDAELNRLSMLDDWSQLNETERQRVFWIQRSFLIGMQGLYRQWTMGVLPDDDWEMWTRIICRNSEGNVFRELWPDNATTLVPAFADYVQASCDLPPRNNRGD